MDQILLHKKIDEIIADSPNEKNLGYIEEYISNNEDARRYFFTKADERWLDLLWKNNLLDILKQKPIDQNKYSYSTPELSYLVKVAEKEPEKITEIILQIPLSKDNFNPEAVDRFLWICTSSLNAKSLAKLVNKIKDEEWIKLISRFNRWGFEYEKMFEKLTEAGDYNSLCVLAEAILEISSKDEQEKKHYLTSDPFYVKDLKRSGVFDSLVSIDERGIEKSLDLTLNTLKKIIVSEKESDGIFEFQDNYYLSDVDFFNLDLNSPSNFHTRDNVEGLAATVKLLLQRAIGAKCDLEERARKLFDDYVNTLPSCHTFWRLRLFTLSLCPMLFKVEIKNAFFRVFESGDRYYQIALDAEYYHLFKNSFFILEPADKKQYIKNTIDFFSQIRPDKDDEKFSKKYGLRILSCIYSELTDEDKKIAKEKLGSEVASVFNPEPRFGQVRGGSVNPKAPVDLNYLSKLSIPEIIKKLFGEWSPESLIKQDKERDFLRPLNAEGMGHLLREDIAGRLKVYLADATLFFDRVVLDEHYTYSFLQGISEVIRSGKYEEGTDFSNLLVLSEKIINSAKENKFEKNDRDGRDSFLVANWSWVHNSLADIAKELLEENEGSVLIDFNKINRNRIFNIIKYLLSFPDPDIANDTMENGSDPFSTAINSTRGRAFEALTSFVYQDSKLNFSAKDEIKISQDVKDLYEETLKKENTRAVMFLYGHYLPSFYFRDKEWIKGLLDKIFPIEPSKFDLFIASWEGYLSSNLFEELFWDLGYLYKRALALDSNSYTKRNYFKDLEEGLAAHLALAFVHFSEFTIESDLFQLFWSTKNVDRHKEFVSFIGRYLISRDDPAAFMLEHKIDASVAESKLKVFWQWVLDKNVEPEVYSCFGFWFGDERQFFSDLGWLAKQFSSTVVKSNGDIEWEHNIIKAFPTLSETDPTDTLNIIRLYLLRQCDAGPGYFSESIYGDSVKSALKIIQIKLPDGKKQVEELVSELLKKGSSKFWWLKSVLEYKK